MLFISTLLIKNFREVYTKDTFRNILKKVVHLYANNNYYFHQKYDIKNVKIC